MDANGETPDFLVEAADAVLVNVDRAVDGIKEELNVIGAAEDMYWKSVEFGLIFRLEVSVPCACLSPWARRLNLT